MRLFLDEAIFTALTEANQSLPQDLLFDHIMSLAGECFRAEKGRTTLRVQIGKQFYFIKKHQGVGWKEIFKNLLLGRLPIISAKSEWLALQKLSELAIHAPKVVGFGERGFNPAQKQSFIIMEEVKPAISLEELTKTWAIAAKPTFTDKQTMIAQVARITRILHNHGINHRDLYICHFLLETNHHGNGKLFLIDLHRAQMRRQTPKRWQIKDLAGLYFSSKDCGLSFRDYLRFISCYRDKPWREVLKNEKKFWYKVTARGNKLYQKHNLANT